MSLNKENLFLVLHTSNSFLKYVKLKGKPKEKAPTSFRQ